MKELKGRVAVVTGAASGIGLALARRFAAEGMSVVLADIDSASLAMAESELKERGTTTLSRRTNVADAGELSALADAAFGRFGSVHVVCNNAGVGGPTGNLWELSEGDWDWVISVNLWSVVHGVRAFVPRMIDGGHEGHIVNTASLAGLAMGNGPYGVTKHGVVALSESLLNQLRMVNANVGVTVLCPGWVNTNLPDSGRHRPPEFGEPGVPERTDPEFLERRAAMRQLLATGFQPEEMADRVTAAIRDRTFYLVPGQPGMMEAVARRHRAIEQGLPLPQPGPTGYGLEGPD